MKDLELSIERLKELRQNFEGKKIAVIGDMMLDCYIRGEVRRISPEAPVPVIEVNDEYNRFGGAANVAYNIHTLGGVPFPIGVLGYDNYSSVFRSLLEETGIENDGLIYDDERPTTAKTRVIAHKQHVVRVDKESTDPISNEVENKLLGFLDSISDNLSGIILQDYNKGVLTPTLIQRVISFAKERDVLITVDPKYHNFYEYQGVTLFKPNRKEASDILNMSIKSDENITAAGNILLEKLHAENILLTLGEGGIAVFQRGKPERRMPTKARKVLDVSGAGDTVISTLTLALAAGADIIEACYLANYAAGIVCEEVGVVPITKETLFDKVTEAQL